MKLAIFSVLSFLRPQRYPQSPSLSHRERVALLVPGWSHRRYRRTGPLRSESSRRMPKKCNSWMTSESCCQAGALAHSPARQSPPYRRGRRCLRAVSYSPRTQTACGRRVPARCRQEPIAMRSRSMACACAIRSIRTLRNQTPWYGACSPFRVRR
jgi:hypothetical protein